MAHRRIAESSLPATRISPLRATLLTYAIPVALLVMGLLYSSRLFTLLQSEAVTLASAAQPLRTLLAQFRYDMRHLPTPIYSLGLHIWLRLSGGAFSWLRVPSAVFYFAGLCLLGAAASTWGGASTAALLLFLAALWPYGFHYGSLVTWYPVAFLLICALTWSYLRYCASPDRRTWAIFVVGLLLIYVTYVGWLLLILLTLDNWLRTSGERKVVRTVAQRWLATFGVFAVAYAPFWPSLIRALHETKFPASLRFAALNPVYRTYVLFAGESVAPWAWRLGVPIAIAALASIVLVFMQAPREARRLLIFAAVLLVTMDLTGSLRSESLLLVAPWFLLPVAAALSTSENRNLRRALTICLVLIAAIAWYGVYVRRYYATAAFYEPWPNAAAGAAIAVREGAGVISNSPQFFLYLTYSLEEPQTLRPWRYVGSLPTTVQNPQVFDPPRWEMSGRPLRPYMLWVRGLGPDSQKMVEAEKWLDEKCAGRTNRYVSRDPAYMWKQRFLPQSTLEPWRIQVHQYSCGEQAPPAPSSGGR